MLKGFHEVPGSIQGEKPLKPLHVFQTPGPAAAKTMPSNWAWLTQHGVYTGALLFGSQQPGGEVVCDNYIIPYGGVLLILRKVFCCCLHRFLLPVDVDIRQLRTKTFLHFRSR
jgi:hypothetical protein